MKIINLLLLLTIISLGIAQEGQRRNFQMQGGGAPPGKISGVLIDGQSQKPLEYGSITIYRAKDSTAATGGVSNSEGKYLVDKIPFGRYYAKVTFIGYTSKKIDNINISPQKTDYFIDTIYLKPKNVDLKEVTVTSDKNMVVNNLDKKVVNVDKNIASTGGTALDVMQNVPSVNVDADGNVSLRGNTNINILIDGKPAGLTGLSNSDILNQIPAGSIDYIELVTNPSVRYDPEGSSGIINLVLKKRIEGGLNGIFSLNAGMNDKYSSTANLNYRTGDFNFFGTVDYRLNNFTSTGNTDRTSYFNNLSTFLNQSSSSRNRMNFTNLTLGTDYNISDFDRLTFTFKYRKMKGENNSSNDDRTDSLTASPFTYSLVERNNSSVRNLNSFDYQLGYKKTFEKKGKELTLDLTFEDNASNRDENVVQTTSIYRPSLSVMPSERKSNSENKNREFDAEGNFMLPMDEYGRIETGFTSSNRWLNTGDTYYNKDLSNNNWIENSLLKNKFKYDLSINAAYAIYSNVLLGLQYQFGLRAEQVFTKSTQVLTDSVYNHDYFSLYPSVHIKYPVSLLTEVQLSYSRRVDRPGMRTLNPFYDFSDSLNVSRGNPYLKPQYINSFELGASTGFAKLFLTGTLFYRQTTGIISSISTLRPNGVTYTTYDNISKGTAYGVELVLQQSITDWWKIMANGSFFSNELEGANSLSSKATTYMTRLNSNMTLFDDLMIQLIGFYTSPSNSGGGFMGGGGFGGGGGGGGGFHGPMAMVQTKTKEMWSLDAAVRKDFFDGKLSLILRVSDIFNSRKFSTETIADNFNMISKRQMESQVFFLGISFKFNNYKQENRNREENISIEDF